MKTTTLILLIAIIMMASCTKPKQQQFAVTMIVTGTGNYSYGIGSTKSSGHCVGSKIITGTASIGDLAIITAKADSANTGIMVELDSNPVVGGSNMLKSGIGSQTAQYQY